MRKIFSVSLALAITSTSCKKFLAIPPPETQVESSTIFTNDASAESATLGVYSGMISASMSIFNGGATIYPSLSADELLFVNPASDLGAFATNDLLPSNFVLDGNIWVSAYKNIYQINSVLKGVRESIHLSTQVKDQIQGEMLFCRALYYYYLRNFFGEVPLITNTDFGVNQSMSRSTLLDVDAQIRKDLLEAIDFLDEDYIGSNRTRANKLTARALLARVALSQGDWSLALSNASMVINSGLYSLTPSTDINSTFHMGSNETIWCVPRERSNTAEAEQLIPFSAGSRPRYTITPTLLNSFETGDLRSSSWIKKSTVNSVTNFFPFKYQSRQVGSVDEGLVFCRLAETYLIRAEASARLDLLLDARDDLNMIRARAQVLPNLDTDKDDLLQAILQERQRELFCEWGMRWFDLKRLGITDSVLAPVKGITWQSSDSLYPIPTRQIQLNPQLTQNPGY